MPGSNRILWGEGLFLRPQHFQQHALFIETAIARNLRHAHGNPWGVRHAKIDSEALRGGALRLQALDAVFRDGTNIDAPKDNPLPLIRDLAAIPRVGTETTVYVCLPAINAFGGNCADSDELTSRPPRYLTDRRQIPDLYTEALDAEVTTLHANLRLMIEEENRDGHLSIALCRIAKNANGAWAVAQEFIPPLVEIAGSAQLEIMLRRLLDILLVKSEALAARHRERVKSIVEYGTSDIASFWLLHTVNRSFPLLNHFLATPTHPEALYASLAQLCGELMTFSSELTLKDIPPYRHENLSEVFSRLDTIIRELLETVVSNRFAAIPLDNTRPSFYIGRLDSERLVENVDYYLSISSEQPTAHVLEMAPLKLKAGSPDDVEKILNSALPGVRLVHAAQTPAALPVRVGNHYFILEPQGQIFERMRQARSICIYVPQALLEFKLELFAVFQ
jgi:type VI secretion system protein ImpJ